MSKKTDPKTVEIPVYFHNYKLLKDKRFLLKGSAIYFIQGPNKVGKTSFLNAIASIQGAKENTKEPVTRGEKEGFKEIVVPGADGKMYTVKHTFDNNKNKFVAIDEDGNKINNVTNIREIFNYTHFTVDDFFKMSNTAKGRRSQKEIILKLLEDDKRKEYNQLEDKESIEYDRRTTIGRNKEMYENTVKESVISNEDQKKLQTYEETSEKLHQHKKFKEDLDQAQMNISGSVTRIEELESNVEKAKATLKYYEDRLKSEKTAAKDLSKPIKEIEKKVNMELIDNENNISLEEFNAKLLELENKKTALTNIRYKHEQYQNSEEKLKDVEKEWKNLSDTITDIRNQKTEIIKNSDLPLKNMSFEDDYLTIDGFTFTEEQVCESDGIILVAKIMSKINPAPVQLIGNASSLDYNRLEELNKIAESEGKIMFIDEVVRDLDDIQVVGYEELNDKKSKNTTKKEENRTEVPGEEEIERKDPDKVFDQAKEKYAERLKNDDTTGNEKEEDANDAKEEEEKKDDKKQSSESDNNTPLF